MGKTEDMNEENHYVLGKPAKLPTLEWGVSSLARIIHAQCESGTFQPEHFKPHIEPYENVKLDYIIEQRQTSVDTTIGHNLIEKIPEEYLIHLVDGKWAKRGNREGLSLVYGALGKGKFKLARAIVEAGINNKDSDVRNDASRCLSSIFEDLERPIEWAVRYSVRYSNGLDKEQYAKELFDFALFSAELYLHGEEIKERVPRSGQNNAQPDLSLACLALDFNPLKFMQSCIKFHLYESFLYATEHALVKEHMSSFSHHSSESIHQESREKNKKMPAYLRGNSFIGHGTNMENFSLFDVALKFENYFSLKWLKENYFDKPNKITQEKTTLKILNALKSLWTDTQNSHENKKTKEKQTLMGIKHTKDILSHLDGKPEHYGLFVQCLELFTPLASGALIAQFPQYSTKTLKIKFENQAYVFSAADYNLIHYCSDEITAAVYQKECAPVEKTINKALASTNKDFFPCLLKKLTHLRVACEISSQNHQQVAIQEEIHLRLLSAAATKEEHLKFVSGIPKNTTKPKI